MDHMTIVDSPIGPLTLSADEDGLTGLHMGALEVEDAMSSDRFGDAIEQLDSYWRGERRAFDLRLSLKGTPFQERVWRALTAIPYGTTISYGELARRVGNPRAVRAVGRANGRNPIAVIVPCHRVIGADGTLTGFGGGLDRKRTLLALEGLRIDR